MNLTKLVLLAGGGWLALGVAHVYVNVGFEEFGRAVRQSFTEERREMMVGFLPVTCHLTCPVVDWTTRHSSSGALYRSKRYSEFPTICEDLTQGTLSAAFVNVPMAMSLVEKGVKIKLVTLGHRDGSAIVVPKDSPVNHFSQLRGKKVLIPSRFSNQQLWLHRLCKENGMALDDLNLVVCPPPDMPALLEGGQCDAYVVGEPHCARAELAGSGRVLLQVKDSWPNFISCGLVVREDALERDRELIQELVDGINGSGLWLEQGIENRFSAAEVVGKYYYNQKPELLKHVLSKPVDRVRYDRLTPLKDDFDEMVALAVEIGMFPEPLPFERWVDTSFASKVPNVPIAMPPDDGEGVVAEVQRPSAVPDPRTKDAAAGEPVRAPR